MSNNSNISNSNVLRFALDFLAEHEKQIDQIANSIAARKDELSANTKRLNVNLDEIISKLQAIEEEIGKLKIIYPNRTS
jgi:hypothetical protein